MRQTKRNINDILQGDHLRGIWYKGQQNSTKVNESKRLNDNELGDQSTLKCLVIERQMNVVRCQLRNSSWPLI